MKPTKIERVIHYEGGLERRSGVECDANGDLVKPSLSEAASGEWDNVTSWFAANNISHLIEPNTLRDHCLAVESGEKTPWNLS